MIIKLDMTSNIPIYVQLRNEIVMGIGRGDLKKGEGLPTVRQMAEDIGVNNMTVNKAYSILKNEGYIEIDRRHGAKINPSLDTTREFKEKLESELELIIAESGLKGIEYKEFMRMCEEIYKNMNGLNKVWNEGKI
ncbi:GntR family transcriptional regulator [Clostridium celatum]|uniref:GntR family transcriptional regulator n=1 Tax=Clostridium celatum TaxID=36834 RepID=UPI001F2C42E2|nr:GntR family transcriptional regulator [Clostridium celatum]MCE9655208.1 GntR family transcriptional regulator [Clostridium celatum]MDU3724011.1 GntR family transcriptional regulator [Clostridium celatum]MDU6296262.1 GntR family transcriptional regulator [Clostridium celatum]MDY3362339.1 GntR family transcriptional regulator [Clostridium celatum]